MTESPRDIQGRFIKRALPPEAPRNKPWIEMGASRSRPNRWAARAMDSAFFVAVILALAGLIWYLTRTT